MFLFDLLNIHIDYIMSCLDSLDMIGVSRLYNIEVLDQSWSNYGWFTKAYLGYWWDII